MSLFKTGLVLLAAALTACASVRNDEGSVCASRRLLKSASRYEQKRWMRLRRDGKRLRVSLPSCLARAFWKAAFTSRASLWQYQETGLPHWRM